MPNENVEKAIEDFQGYLIELENCFDNRKQEIRRAAVTCDDLMNYSDLVADTSSPRWKLLCELVHNVLVKTNGVLVKTNGVDMPQQNIPGIAHDLVIYEDDEVIVKLTHESHGIFIKCHRKRNNVELRPRAYILGTNSLEFNLKD
jgi:hypothetical protein